jgi:ABC-type multidrug transport system fused ATPase/permease subunit
MKRERKTGGAFRRTWQLLGRRYRSKVLWLMCLMILSAVVNLASINAVGPLIQILLKPGSTSIEWFNQLADFTRKFGVVLNSDILPAAFFFLIVVGNGLFLIVMKLSFDTTARLNTELSSRLFKKYLDNPYVFYLNRNTSELTKNIFVESDTVSDGILGPLLLLCSNGALLVLIIASIISHSPLVALAAILIVGGAFALLALGLRRTLHRIGARRVASNQNRFRVANEAFGTIKYSKFMGSEAFFSEKMVPPARDFYSSLAKTRFIGGAPRYVLEVFMIGGLIAAASLFRSGSPEALENVVSSVSFFLFAGYRMIPAIQQIFLSISNIRANASSLSIVLKEFGEGATLEAGDGNRPAEPPTTPRNAGSLASDICFEDVSFWYRDESETILDKVQLRIRKHETIGIVGETGSGKTTLIDLLLGLLPPKRGRILFDGVPLDELDRARLSSLIGYVPQDVLLLDDTIRKNVAFGLPDTSIKNERVIEALRQASIFDFISESLPEGLEAVVGERGVRLSGGQKQRIGIARALYRDPELIVLDEATSALDTETEASVIDAVTRLIGTKTIIIITHRTSSLGVCDRIFRIGGTHVREEAGKGGMNRAERGADKQ